MELEKGSHVRVVTAEGDRDSTDGKIIWVDYPSLPKVLKKGGKIYIDDGLIGLKVLETGNTHKVHFNKPRASQTPSYLLFSYFLISNFKMKEETLFALLLSLFVFIVVYTKSCLSSVLFCGCNTSFHSINAQKTTAHITRALSGVLNEIFFSNHTELNNLCMKSSRFPWSVSVT